MNRAAQHDELLGELASKRARLKSDPWRFSELVAQADLACGQNDSVQDGALQLDQVATDVQARVEVGAASAQGLRRAQGAGLTCSSASLRGTTRIAGAALLTVCAS